MESTMLSVQKLCFMKFRKEISELLLIIFQISIKFCNNVNIPEVFKKKKKKGTDITEIDKSL